MIVTQLKIQNLRIIEEMELHPVQGLNFICGDNGAGKTSVLESLYLLGQGKSFRHSEAGPLIRYGDSFSTVFTELESVTGSATKLGIQRNRKQFLARHSGKNIQKRSELMRLLPLQLITPQSHELIERGPELRRRYLDFGLFHVEQGYHRLLMNYHRALKQRNAALRENNIRLARSFNDQLISCSDLIVQSRDSLLGLVRRQLEIFLSSISFPVALDIHLTKGWNKALSLEEMLSRSEEKDLSQGFTGSGIHRAQLKITTAGSSASKLLSRGQQKILVYGLVLGLSEIIQKHTLEPSLLLIDDLGAELDATNTGLMLEYLRGMRLQTFITTLDAQHLCRDEADKVFHVEQGVLKSAS
jgi:DNA replication and repair protein RecF